MEDNDHTIESSDETSGVDAPSEEEMQPSEATQWAEKAEEEGDDSGYDPDEDLSDLADEPAED